MGTQLEYSWAVLENLPEIQAFLVTTYGGDSIQAFPERCRWLYFENPLGLHISICRADGKLVAVCGHLPQQIRMGDKMVLAGFGIDFMVTKKWRRCGIGRKFLKMRLDRFSLSLSLGQSKDMNALYRSLEAVDLGPLHLGIHRARPSFSGGLKALARKNIAWSKSLGGLRPPADWTFDTCEIPQVAPQTSQPEWFSWRYNSRPYGDYCCWQPHTGKDAPLVVFRNTPDHVVIVDIYCEGKERSAVLASIAGRSQVAETRILVAGNRLKADCAKAGFWVRPLQARVIAMTTDPNLRNSLKPGIFDMTAGSADADLLRVPSGT